MLKHPERVASIGEGRTVAGDDFAVIEVDYVTEGGIRKTLRLAHSDADKLRVMLIGELDAMDPEVRKASFMASARRKR